MNQKESPALQTRGSIGVDGESFPRFEIANLSAVEYGRIRWTFDLKVGPITLEFRVIVGEDGQPKFVAPGAIKDAYTQSYRSTVDISREFGREVFDAVVAQLEGGAKPASTPRTRVKDAPAPGRNAWVMDQEDRFERASAEMEGAA